MRVYEFTKQHGLSSKEIVSLLQESGFSVASHMSLLTPEALQFLEAKYIKKNDTKQESPVVQESIQQKNNHKAVKPKDLSEKSVSQFSHVKKTSETPVRHAQERQEFSGREDKKVHRKNPEVERKPMTVGELALATDKPLSEVVLTLLRQGCVATKNQILPEATVAQVAHAYGIKVVEPVVTAIAQVAAEQKVAKTEGQERLPVVVVIGHVDHGKTTLLDFIRKTRVAAREKGGITQHLGAYEVTTDQGNIIFLDTPGHEAFSMMRVRGIKVADVAILVVAADDGVMPQTIEAIRRAREAQLPVIVAINKVDKVSPQQVENVKKALAQHGLVSEDWGGETPCMPISAKMGTGIKELLEIVVLQSQLLELKADSSVLAQGFVLESRLEKGRGPVATVICQEGTVHVGDHFIAGSTVGKVSSLVNSSGQRILSAGPSVPVSVSGFSELARVGDAFTVVSAEEFKKMRGKTDDIRAASSALARQVVPENALNLVIKTDCLSSQEALLTALQKISGTAFKQFYVVSAGIGAISESDVILAADTKSMIYALHARIEPSAHALGQKLGVTVKLYDIIYKLLENLQELAEQGKPVQKITKKIGEATVIKVFDIKNLGVIAGAHVRSGRFAREGKVIVYRGKHKVAEGSISSLQRDRKSVKEVHSGFEFAFMVDGFTEWQIDDRVECYIETVA